MRRHVECAQVGDECRCVATLVGSKGEVRTGRMAHDHLFGRLAFASTGRLAFRPEPGRSLEPSFA
jgi:hypothetical protein